MKVTILGTGWWSVERAGPAHLISIDDSHILFDCGKNATMQLIKAGISLPDISHVFITHQHFDHNVDFINFVFASWIMGRSKPLILYGPDGTSKLVENLFGPEGFYAGDIKSRSQIPGLPMEGIGIRVNEVTEPGNVCSTDEWQVRTTLTKHTEFFDTWAYRFDSKQGSVVMAADSGPTENVVNLAKDADLLVHECTGTEEFVRTLKLTGHSSSRDVGQTASAAGVRMVALVHFGEVERRNLGKWWTRIDEEKLVEMVDEVKENFDGEVILGEDLKTVNI